MKMEKLELLKENDLKMQWNHDKGCPDWCLFDCNMGGGGYPACNEESTDEY
jgi:hypothetical protein